MSISKVLIITGMHRSGTSLVASILQNAGVSIGNKLIGGAKGNPRGHFEDLSFLSFHEEILRRNHKTFLVQDLEGLRDFSPEDVEKARQLVQDRLSFSVWGWKDPRTTLFLQFWLEMIPHANYIFLYRHPITVCHSLLRRGAVYPENDPAAGLIAWHIYNQEIIDFIQQHPKKCFLGNIDIISEDFPGFISKINQKFNLSLKEKIDPAIFHSSELTRQKYDGAVIEAFEQLMPEPFALYRELEKLADAPEDGRTLETHFDKDASAALRVILDKNLSPQDSLESKLNFLFALLDPQLSYMRATGLNALILEKENLASAVRSLDDLVKEKVAIIEITTSQLDSLTAQIHKRDDLLKALQAQIYERQGVVQSLQAQLVERNAHVQLLTSQFYLEVERHKTEMEYWKTEAVNYALSTSWRITRPLRTIGRWIKGKNGAG